MEARVAYVTTVRHVAAMIPFARYFLLRFECLPPAAHP